MSTIKHITHYPIQDKLQMELTWMKKVGLSFHQFAQFSHERLGYTVSGMRGTLSFILNRQRAYHTSMITILRKELALFCDKMDWGLAYWEFRCKLKNLTLYKIKSTYASETSYDILITEIFVHSLQRAMNFRMPYLKGWISMHSSPYEVV